MYYFEILKLLEANRGTRFTSMQIYLSLSEEGKVCSKNLKRVLFKMVLKHPSVEREMAYVNDARGPNKKKYVYFLK